MCARARTFSGVSRLGFRVVKRVLLVLCTLTWWVLPGMGVIDLTVTWDPTWPVMLEGGWGVLLTVGLGLPFLVAAVRPRLARAALVQVYAVTAALLVGAVVGQEPQAWWLPRWSRSRRHCSISSPAARLSEIAPSPLRCSS